MASLIDAAYQLASAEAGRPSQPYLRRAVSTAYFAVFDALAQNCADLLMGGGSARGRKAWLHTYRALDHGFAKNACKSAATLGFPKPSVAFCVSFIALQEERQGADYDPSTRYSREDALTLVQRADGAIAALVSAARYDRRAFAILVLLKKR